MLTNIHIPKFENYNDEFARIMGDQYPTLNNKNTSLIPTITFQVTEDCCLKCTYCYQQNKSNKSMSFIIAKQFIDTLLEDKIESMTTQNVAGIVFEFIGGEPFLQINVIQEICEYTLNRMLELKHPWLPWWRISICSNGILYFNSQVQSFFDKFGKIICFSISIDGTKELHDRCRIDSNGNGSYDKAMAAAMDYKTKFNKLPYTKVTISPDNLKGISESIIHLFSLGHNYIACNCVFEDVWNTDHPKIMYQEAKIIADYILDNNIYENKMCRLFLEDGYIPMNPEDNTNWCGGVNNRNIAISPDGDLYQCIRYMKSSLDNDREPLNIGNVSHGLYFTEEEKKHKLLGENITRRSQSTDECFYCPIAQGCAWCSAYNYQVTGSVNIRVTNHCNMHKAQSLANVYFWNKLARKINQPERCKMYCPKEWALEIIDEDEYNMLLELSSEDSQEIK